MLDAVFYRAYPGFLLLENQLAVTADGRHVWDFRLNPCNETAEKDPVERSAQRWSGHSLAAGFHRRHRCGARHGTAG